MKKHAWITPIVVLFILIAGNCCANAEIYSARRGVAVAALVNTASVGGRTRYEVSPVRCSPYASDRLRDAGFELVRMVVNPLPLVQANEMSRDEAYRMVMRCAEFFLSSDLAVVIDLHFWSPSPEKNLEAALGSDAGMLLYRGALVKLATGLSDLRKGMVALELLNEPPVCDGRSKVNWTEVQMNLLTSLRAEAPDLPVVVTGCGGQLDGLVTMSAAPYASDPNLIYSFHFYEPFIFTHQQVYYGAKFGDLRYPQPALETSRLDKAVRSAMANGGASANDQASVFKDVRNYLRSGSNKEVLRKRFETVDGWARRYGIPRGRIFLGEFGVVFTPESNRDGLLADDTMRWLKDIVSLCEDFGYSYSLWGLPDEGPFRERIISALKQ